MDPRGEAVKRIWTVEPGQCGVCLSGRTDLTVGTYYDWQGEVFVIQLECAQCHTVIEEELTRLRREAHR